jgi:hypothetical protein
MSIIILDTTSRSLRAALSEAKTTNEVTFTLHYADHYTGATPTLTEDSVPVLSNGVTNKEILAAPAATTSRLVRTITVHNTDTVTHTITIYYRDTATDYPIWTKTLAPNAWYSVLDTMIEYSGVVPISSGGTGAITAALARTALGLGTIATQDANNVTISGGAITGITDLAVADGGTGASTAAAAIANLGGLPLAGGTMSGTLNGGAQALINFKGTQNSQSDSYTTVDADNGKVIVMTKATACTLTIHQAAAADFNVLVIQAGAGQVTIAAGGTGAIKNRSTQTKIAGQYGMVSCYVLSNAGTAPQVYLAGDTGA